MEIIESTGAGIIEATPSEVSQTNIKVMEAIKVEQECCDELDNIERNLRKLSMVIDARKLKSVRVRKLMEAVSVKL